MWAIGWPATLRLTQGMGQSHPPNGGDRQGPRWFAGVLNSFSSSVNKGDIGGKRKVGGGVEFLVNMKEAGNRSL
jgi:hypothetical protein